MANDKNNLNTLPPPPSGQKGVTLDSLKGLPPPPKNGQGLTLEQLKRDSDNQSPVKDTGTGGIFNKYQKPEYQKQAVADVSSQYGKNLFDFFTSATQALGRNVGNSAMAPKNVKLYTDTLQNWSNIDFNVRKQINTMKQAGKDTTLLDQMIKLHEDSKPVLEDFVGLDTARRMRESFTQNLEEVAGQGVGTVLEAMSGGMFESGAGTIADQGLSTGQKFIAGSKLGFKYGAVSGLASGMENEESAGGVAASTVEGAALGAGLGGATEVLPDAAGKISSKVKGLVGDIRNVFTAKTEPEILATAESQLHKLNPSERKFWFQNEREKITQSSGQSNLTKEQILNTPEDKIHSLNPNERKFYFDSQRAKLSGDTEIQQKKISDAFDQQQDKIKAQNDSKIKDIEQKSLISDTKAKQDLKVSSEKSQSDAQKLQRQLDVSSRDKVLELRPKIKEALGKQSEQYRKLADEAIAPVKDTVIEKTDLGNFIDDKFKNDPEKAQLLKDKLGIKTIEPNLPPARKQLIEATGENKTTLGDLYQETQGIKRGISSTSKKGSRVYTPEEKTIDDTVSTLMDFMQTKGLDMSAPREFWAKYAPVRDQLVSEGQPFNVAGTKTEKLATTLTNVAKGEDVHNENFINEVNNLLGEDVTSGQKSILEKMNSVEKQKLADKIDIETKKADIKFKKDKAIEDAKIEKEQEIKKSQSEKQSKEEQLKLQKDKESGKISDKEFTAQKDALDQKAKEAQQKSSDLAQLSKREFAVEQKAKLRGRIKNLLKLGLIGAGGYELGKATSIVP